MVELLLGESKLEQYLKEHPLRQGASPRGPRPQLTEVRKHLTAALDRGNLKVPWASGMMDREGGEMLVPPPPGSMAGKEALGQLGSGPPPVQLVCQPWAG